MFILKKILTPFLIPPGLFITIIMVAGIWFFYKNQKKSAYTYIIIAAVFWLASIKPVTDIFMSKLEYHFALPASFDGDVIIVLGGGMQDNVPDFSGDAALNSGGIERVFTAARIAKKMNIPIIASGGAVFSRRAESEVAKRFLTDIGIAPEKIIVENKSRDTYENALFSREICLKQGYKKVIVVTSAFHMPRTAMIFKKAGFENVVYYPTGYKTSKKSKYYYVDFLPGDMQNLSVAIKEYIGLVYYKVFY
ncbi:MAG: YdcF family protein [Elusimicrobiales bacterium]|nr:YdcF family protein [Elusimicrobiales bacterium]